MNSHECAATKRCSKCKQVKPVDEFYQAAGKPTAACKSCKLKACAERRVRKASQIQAWMADYYRRNRQKVLDRTKAYQARPEVKHRETERHRIRWLRDRERLAPIRKAKVDPAKVREYSRLHYRKNKSAYLAKWAERRSTKLRATPAWADLNAIKAIYEKCRQRREATGLPYEVDHIVPLVSPTVCGLHVEHNLRIILMQANRAKSNKLVEDIVRHSA